MQLVSSSVLDNSVTVKKLIASGTFGDVYDIGNNQVEKVIRTKPSLVNVPRTQKNTDKVNELRELVSEIKFAEGIKKSVIAHKYLIKIIDVSYDELLRTRIYMEKASGSLRDIIYKGGETISDERILKWGNNIAKGLFYLHSQNVIHHDLKPGNVLLVNDVAKIADFGKSIHIENANDPLQGTYTYIPPRLLDIKNKSYQFDIDIWGLGCIMLEATLRDVPFSKESISEQAEYITQKLGASLTYSTIKKYLYEIVHDKVNKDLIEKISKLFSECVSKIDNINVLSKVFTITTISKDNSICDNIKTIHKSNAEQLYNLVNVTKLTKTQLTEKIPKIQADWLQNYKKKHGQQNNDTFKQSLNEVDIKVLPKIKALFGLGVPKIDDELLDDIDKNTRNVLSKLTEQDKKQLEPIRQYYGSISPGCTAKAPRWYKIAAYIHNKNNKENVIEIVKKCTKTKGLNYQQALVSIIEFLK